MTNARISIGGIICLVFGLALLLMDPKIPWSTGVVGVAFIAAGAGILIALIGD